MWLLGELAVNHFYRLADVEAEAVACTAEVHNGGRTVVLLDVHYASVLAGSNGLDGDLACVVAEFGSAASGHASYENNACGDETCLDDALQCLAFPLGLVPLMYPV